MGDDWGKAKHVVLAVLVFDGDPSQVVFGVGKPEKNASPWRDRDSPTLLLLPVAGPEQRHRRLLVSLRQRSNYLTNSFPYWPEAVFRKMRNGFGGRYR
jgi:hypothetical protein